MPSSETIIKELAKNNISLQKVTIKLVENTDKLNKRIDKLLELVGFFKWDEYSWKAKLIFLVCGFHVVDKLAAKNK